MVMSARYCFDNGEIVKLEDVVISPYDLGFLRGFAVFDVMRAHGGKLVFGRNHFARFVQSAHTLGMAVPMLMAEFEQIAEALLRKNEMSDVVIRMVLTGGVAADAMTFQVGSERLMILIEPLQLPPETVYVKGAKVATVDYQRELPEVKHANYMEAIMVQSRKVETGSLELLYVKNDIITEASTSNIFIVKNGVVITPREGILMGITRKFVIEVAQNAQIEVEQREVSKDELLDADEVFLTATNKAVVPVVKIDKQQIANGRPGEITKKLMTLFENFVKMQ